MNQDPDARRIPSDTFRYGLVRRDGAPDGIALDTRSPRSLV